jgi:signal transduction histidine kinase
MTRALKKNGDALYVDMSFAMVKNRAGQMTGSLAVARDATARFMAERAARVAASGTTPAG